MKSNFIKIHLLKLFDEYRFEFHTFIFKNFLSNCFMKIQKTVSIARHVNINIKI